MSEDKNVMFIEEQRFARTWITVALLIMEFFLLITFAFALLSGKINGSILTILPFILISLLPILLLFLSIKTKLRVEIYNDEVCIFWIPFNKIPVAIKLSQISKVQLIKYNFLGYGWRISQKYGNVHNVKGNKGLFIQLKNGSKYLIGTQKPEELQNALTALGWERPEKA